MTCFKHRRKSPDWHLISDHLELVEGTGALFFFNSFLSLYDDHLSTTSPQPSPPTDSTLVHSWAPQDELSWACPGVQLWECFWVPCRSDSEYWSFFPHQPCALAGWLHTLQASKCLESQSHEMQRSACRVQQWCIWNMPAQFASGFVCFFFSVPAGEARAWVTDDGNGDTLLTKKEDSRCQLSTSSLEASRNSRTVRRLSRKRRDAGKGKALCNSICTLRLRRVRKHGELLILCATRSLTWLVSVQIVCVHRAVFIMLCHADLRPNKLYVFEPIDRRSGFRRSKKKKEKKKEKAGQMSW